MYLAPLMRRFGWKNSDVGELGAGTLVGHLMECGMQITGGYFADPGIKDVPNLAQCGYPIAEVSADGSAVITKLPGTGGFVTEATVKEQLLYEVHDPENYLTPDVTADFSHVEIKDHGNDRPNVSRLPSASTPVFSRKRASVMRDPQPARAGDSPLKSSRAGSRTRTGSKRTFAST